MKTIILISLLLSGSFLPIQAQKTVEYNFPSKVQEALVNAVTHLDTKAGLFLQVGANDRGYVVHLRNMSLYSKEKQEKILKSNRYAKIGKADYSIWFDWDDLFSAKSEPYDVFGNSYTIIFDADNHILSEFKGQ